MFTCCDLVRLLSFPRTAWGPEMLSNVSAQKKKIPKDIFICHTKEFYNNVHINIKRSLLFVDNPGKMVW